MARGAKGERINGATCFVPSKYVSVTIMEGGECGLMAAPGMTFIKTAAPMRRQPVENTHRHAISMTVSKPLFFISRMASVNLVSN